MTRNWKIDDAEIGQYFPSERYHDANLEWMYTVISILADQPISRAQLFVESSHNKLQKAGKEIPSFVREVKLNSIISLFLLSIVLCYLEIMKRRNQVLEVKTPNSTWHTNVFPVS